MNSRTLFRRIRKSSFFLIGIITVLIIVTLAIISPMIVAHDAYIGDLELRLKEPEGFAGGWEGYILGCDPLGRDVLTRVLIGSRASMLIALTVVGITLVTGTILGLISGYYGGLVDMCLMRLCDILMATPGLLLAVCVVAVLGSNFVNLIIVLSITGWVRYARLVRGNVLAIRNSEYIQASRVLGAGNAHIILTQVLPNITTPLIIQASQQFGNVILIEAGMSFLGVGVPISTPS